MMVSKSEITVKSANPNGVTRLESTIPFTIPKITQIEQMIILANARLRTKYTKVSDAKTIKEL